MAIFPLNTIFFRHPVDNWTVSDVTGHAGVIGQYLANAIISDKSK